MFWSVNKTRNGHPFRRGLISLMTCSSSSSTCVIKIKYTINTNSRQDRADESKCLKDRAYELIGAGGDVPWYAGSSGSGIQ